MILKNCGWCDTPRLLDHGSPMCPHCDRACEIRPVDDCAPCKRMSRRYDPRVR